MADQRLEMTVEEEATHVAVTCRQCGWWVVSTKRERAREKALEHALKKHNRLGFHFVDITPLDA